ncbi:hypothetical protein FO519_002370 [Halicephalobus sp. NKZ332]|nr:hypothetical protein FO519_002370 [Halicephalobus sp. NKZ332]
MLEIPLLRNLFQSVKKTDIDDVTDRISYFWTTTICFFFALLTGSRMFFGKPIECMMPAEYPSNWGDYIRQYCYITTTYDKEISKNWNATEISSHAVQAYYQWVPMVLILQALSIYFPHLLWKFAQKYNSIDFEHVVKECRKLRYSVASDRDKSIVSIVDYLKMHLSYQGVPGNRNSAGFGSFNSLLHMFSKALTIGVIIGNVIFMNYFFGMGNSPFWGLSMAYNSLTNVDWEDNGIFPRVTYCQFTQKDFVVKNIHTVQCVLMINMLNEKIFAFLWSTSYDIFADTTLGPDGIQLLDLIKEHAGGIVASQIACALLDNMKLRAPSSAISHDSGSLPRNNVYIINEKDFISKAGKSL